MDNNGDGIKDFDLPDLTLDNTEYVKIIRFLECFKIHNGNIALNRTLVNHPKIHKALLNYEKVRIMEIERVISNLE